MSKALTVCVLTQSSLTLGDLMDCRPPGFSVQGFSRQEDWSELPFLPQDMVLTQGWNPCSCVLLHWQECFLPLYCLGILACPVCNPSLDLP